MAECYNKIYIKRNNIWVNCGKCLNCISEKNKEYTVRMIHETQDKSVYPLRYMLTLTYDEVNVPIKNNLRQLNKKHLTEYIEKLQRYIRTRNKKREKANQEQIKFKYFACGEYGETSQRPHYHIVIATNIFIERAMKTYWKKGHVDIQYNISNKAIAYTCQYTQKKIKKDDYDKELRTVAFRKFSRGLGKERIHELIAKNKVNKDKYYIETTFYNKCRIPTYYKNILKEHITGVKEKRILIKNWMQRLEAKQLGYENSAKTFVRNINEVEKNMYKWENFIKEASKYAIEKEAKLFKDKKLYKRYANNKELVYNLMYNENYETTDYEKILFKQLLETLNTNRKIEAEQKYLRRNIKRVAI